MGFLFLTLMLVMRYQFYRRLEYEIPESTGAMIYLCLMGIMKRYSSFIPKNKPSHSRL